MMKIPVAGIYISWPFCAQKCTYCNFASGVLPRELESRYLEAVLKEIAAHSWRHTPDTVYLGGGTPSAADPAHLEQLLTVLPGNPWREATIEAAPGTITVERIGAWQRAGINRVSLGVQSFVRQELARTGRKHAAETVVHDVALLRAHGIRNINIDLIAGLPGQSGATWNESLDATLNLDPPHVSVYMLEVDDDSRLGSEILLGGKRYGASDVPSDDAIADFYEGAVERLRAHGIERYEISNFARPGLESLHNLKYWKRAPYMGFGADAHSFDGASRWQNVESAQDYVARLERGESPRQEESSPDPSEEKFFVGLRLTEGVNADASDWRRFGPAFERFLSDGLLEKANGNLRLTPRGVMVSNEIFQEFLTA
ncbi:MAG TPA: radical SAM family heme chaperone HemW [Bryobacteraceae bacterium]|nr:radical SAM family heme chaperone HemW [Bryobacteraceae bacterium]